MRSGHPSPQTTSRFGDHEFFLLKWSVRPRVRAFLEIIVGKCYRETFGFSRALICQYSDSGMHFKLF